MPNPTPESHRVTVNVPFPQVTDEDTLIGKKVSAFGLSNVYQRPNGSRFEVPILYSEEEEPVSETPERSKVLKEADNLINGDRQEQYGPPSLNFQRIVDLWNVLVPRPDREWTTGDVALALIGLKMARAAQGYKRDTYVDLAGYAALAVELNEMEDE